MVKFRPATVQPLSPFSDEDVKGWLEKQAATHDLKWFLAHAEDGVIWGHREDQALLLSSDVADISPPLHATTLQTARLFAPHAELLLWRDGDSQWHACLINDAASIEGSTWHEAIDETQILWGTKLEKRNGDFTLMSDGAQGFRHAVPLKVEGDYNEQIRPLRLHVRHYLSEDEVRSHRCKPTI
jgi:CRISPR-associated protein (TIGR03984 family)